MQKIWRIGLASLLLVACGTEVEVVVEFHGETMDNAHFEVWLTDSMTCRTLSDSLDVPAIIQGLEASSANARVEPGDGVVVGVTIECEVFYGCAVWEEGTDSVLVVVDSLPYVRCDDECVCSDGGTDMGPDDSGLDAGTDAPEEGGVDAGPDGSVTTECELTLVAPTQLPHPDTQLPTCVSPGMIAVATGFRHACALSEEGDAYCWGRNRHGAVDPTDGASGGNLLPTRVTWTGSSPIRQIAAGHQHTCAVTNDGVYCWGNDGGSQNRLGALGAVGDGPVLTPGCFSEISMGLYHTCGVNSGQVWCWGPNDGGELGRAGAVERDQAAGPTDEALTREHVVAGVGNSCAWNDDDAASLRCWGYNRNFAVGRTTGVIIPIAPLSIDSGAPIVMGATHTEFVLPPDGTSDACTGLPGAFYGNTCAIIEEGVDSRLYCWGTNPCGGAGSGTMSPVRGPAQPFRSGGVPLDGWDWKLAVGAGTSCLLRRDPAVSRDISELVCWGDDSHGQLEGHGQALRPTSHRLLFTHDVIDVDVGGAFVCAISEWRVHCWGYNSHGQVQPGTESTSTPHCVAIP